MAFQLVIGSSKPGDHGPLQAALRRKGIEARVYADGMAMIEAAKNASLDMVVVDLHLGGLHGIEVANSLEGQRTSVLVDEDEAGVQDLRRLGLELLVRPRGGAEALAETIAQRLKGTERLLADATGLDDVVGLRGRLLELVEGSEERLLRTVLEDPDTHLLNGTYVKAWRVEEEWLRSRTTQAPLSLLRVGLDGGSSDLARRHGVDALRDVEQRLAGLLLSELSGNDLPAREGNGRFLVLMPDTTADEAARRAFAVRGEFAEFQFQGRGGPFQISLCMGLAAIPHQHVASAADLLTRADEALEAAARLGPGRVCLWQGVQELREDDYR